MIACVLVLLTGPAWADKAEIEKKAKTNIISLTIKDMSVGSALDYISAVGGIKILQVDIPKDDKVSVDLKNVPVLDYVTYVTAKAGLTYAIVDDGIAVSGKKEGRMGRSQASPSPAGGR